MLSTVLFRNNLPFWEDWRSSNYHHIHINISNMTSVTINEHINNKNVKVSKQLFLISFLPFLYRVLFRGCQVLVNLIHFELPGPHLKSRLYATKIKKELKRSSYLLDTTGYRDNANTFKILAFYILSLVFSLDQAFWV